MSRCPRDVPLRLVNIIASAAVVALASSCGASHPAPGVVIPSPGQEGWAIIGSSTMCLAEVTVRVHPTRQDAVLVGEETWYLSRAACPQARAALVVAGSCSALVKRPKR